MNNNYRLLKENYPNIYKQVESVKPNSIKYELIITRKGLYTLKINEEESFYLHSKYDPIRESQKLIDENHDLDVKNYLIYGLGFGYHIKELLKRDENIHINIIECNVNILKIALDNIDLGFILDNKNINLYLGSNIQAFSKFFEEATNFSDSKLILHNASIKAIPNNLKEIKYLLEEFKVKELSIKNKNYDLDDNFEYNKDNYDEIVNTLFNKYNDKPIFLVSAGPSLDKNKHLLKYISNDGVILSVGRAVRVLLKEEVTPDLIIITDPSENLYDMQLKDLDIDAPIVVLSTCDKNVMKNYKGKKYIALQNGFEKAEKYAKKIGVETIETGGSVATTALDIAIRMGGNPIVFVGQDLAFSDGQTHSRLTYSKEIREVASLRKIKNIEGKEIYTSKNLNIYLRWIENRIRQEKDIEFIDATEGGAKIEGTKIKKLKDIKDNIK